LGRSVDMRRQVERLVKKTLRNFDAEILFASLFGSYKRGEHDVHSDIDVFAVYEDGVGESGISRGLKHLERVLDRPVHVNLFNLKEFERRLRFHDYLTASIIEDSSFILGERDSFSEAKRYILNTPPDEESIRFNMKMGFSTFRRVYSSFDELNSVKPYHRRDLLDRVVRGLNDYRLALGYIYAGAQMQDTGKCASYRRLTHTSLGSVLKEIACIEREMKRRSKIEHATLSNLSKEIKNKSLRILAAEENSSRRLISLIKSLRLVPSL